MVEAGCPRGILQLEGGTASTRFGRLWDTTNIATCFELKGKWGVVLGFLVLEYMIQLMGKF